MEQRLIGAGAFAVGDLPEHAHARIQLAEHFIDPGGAGDHRVLAGNDGGAGLAFGGNELSGNVATADVFVQGATDIGLDLGAELGKGKVGHGCLRCRMARL
ncbi:hypothetical protein D3C78_1716790 [compost metagenome]